MEMLILFSIGNKYLKGHTPSMFKIMRTQPLKKLKVRKSRIRALCYSIINSKADDKVEKSTAL